MPPGRYETTNDSSEIIWKIIPIIVKTVLLTPIAKYKVANNEPRYIRVNGTRSFVTKCFKKEVNPHNIDRLLINKHTCENPPLLNWFARFQNQRYLANENTLPRVKNILNLRAANKRTGIYNVDSTKKRIPIPSSTKKPMILSFLD